MVSKKSGLLMDKCRVVNGKLKPLQTTTSPTNIGMGLTSYVAARDLKLETEEEARNAILKILKTTRKLERHKSGLFYAWYETESESPSVTDRYVPSIDNANLTTALKITSEAFRNDTTPQGREITKIANEIIDSQNYSIIYDKKAGLLVGGINRSGLKETWHPAGTLGS